MATEFLSYLKSTLHGQCLLINLHDSLIEESLIKPEQAREFLARCERIWVDSGRTEEASRCAQQAALGEIEGTEGPLMRTCRITDASHDQTNWRNVVSWRGFFGHQVERTLLEDHGFDIAPSDPEADDDSISQLIDDLATLGTWWQQGARLGRPPAEGSTCWVSAPDLDPQDFDEPLSDPLLASKENSRLGLGHKHPAWLLRYEFDAPSARAAVLDDVARACVLDVGNEWFRVFNPDVRARENASKGWGCTAQTSADEPLKQAGRSERVTHALLIESLSKLRVDCLGQVTPTPQPVTQMTFRDTLLGTRSLEALELAVLQRLGAQSAK
jgi:hypothetical protein